MKNVFNILIVVMIFISGTILPQSARGENDPAMNKSRFDFYKEIHCEIPVSNNLNVVPENRNQKNSQLGQWNWVGPDSASQVLRFHNDKFRNMLYIGTSYGFWYCSIDDFVWTRREIPGSIGRTVWSIATHPNIPGRIISGRVNPFFKGYIDITSDWGLTFQGVYSSQGGLFNDVKNVPLEPNTFYASGWSDITPGDLVKTTNGGLNFLQLSNTIHHAKTEIAVDPFNPNVVYVSGTKAITKTTDGGANWLISATGIPPDRGAYCVSIANNNSNLLICSSDSGIHRSTDGGLNWSYSSRIYVVRRFAFNPLNPMVIAGVTFPPYNIIISTNGGIDWQLFPDTLNIEPKMDVCFSPDGTKLFVATLNNGVYWTDVSSYVPVELISFNYAISGNNVTLNWMTASEKNNKGFEIEKSISSASASLSTSVSASLSTSVSASLSTSRQAAVSNWESIGFVNGAGTTTHWQNYFFTDKNVSSGKYFYRLKQIDFDGSFEYSNEIEIEIGQPTEFVLYQNYPNPFNPNTKIKYAVSGRQFVTLKVYDNLGREVATIVNQQLEAGYYNYDWDASAYASSMYIYQLRAGDFVQTKKMLLIK